jgi:hypothetical protein
LTQGGGACPTGELVACGDGARHTERFFFTASFRAWVYRIATNTCLDMLRQRQRRVLPQDVRPPVAPGPPTTAIREDISWLEPCDFGELVSMLTEDAVLTMPPWVYWLDGRAAWPASGVCIPRSSGRRG